MRRHAVLPTLLLAACACGLSCSRTKQAEHTSTFEQASYESIAEDTSTFEQASYESIAPGGARWWIWSLAEAPSAPSEAVVRRLQAHATEVARLEAPEIYSVKQHEGARIVVFDDAGAEDVAVAYVLPATGADKRVVWFYVPM